MKNVSSLLILFLLSLQTIACTTFFINKNGQLVFGRNYDWISGEGMVCTNNRGLYKTSMKEEDGITASWVSKFGSMTFNQYGKEFPTGGMNEKGLVVELMWEDGTKYPKADKRPALGVLQWIQFQLDNYETIDEVIASDAVVRISQNNPPLHYLIADAKGNAATIEFIEGKMVVHRGRDLPFPVLTNSPYDKSAGAVTSVGNLNDNTSNTFRDNSLQRFTKACSMVQQFTSNEISRPIVDYSFDILAQVSQGDFTKWSIVYDLVNKKVYFKTAAYTSIKSFSFQSFNFDCATEPKAIDMNQPLAGSIDKNFHTFTSELHRRIVEKTVLESRSQVPISEKGKESLVNYTSGIKCNVMGPR